MKTRKLTVDAMLSAMCATLGFISVDLGNLKITFESLPVFVAALLFGPTDGLLVGAVGTLIYQLLRYGVTLTTPLWMLPYAAAGLLLGLYARKKAFSLTGGRLLAATALSELLITALNTAALYADSKLYGYYSAAYIFGSLGIRLLLCAAKSIAFGLLLAPLLRAARKAVSTDTERKGLR